MTPGYLRRSSVGVAVESGALWVDLPDGSGSLRLDEVSADIWEGLEYPTNCHDIAGALDAAYEGDRADIEHDLETLVAEWVSRGLVQPTAPPSATDVQRQRYLWLVKRALVERVSVPVAPQTHEPELDFIKRAGGLWQGRAPESGYTTAALSGLDGLERCAEDVFSNAVTGDFFEAGVGRGGAAIFMRALQHAHGETHRRVWLADVFPVALSSNRRGHGIHDVRQHFRQFDLLDSGLVWLPGRFADTLTDAPITELALLRCDTGTGDGTRQVLDALYDRVSHGGFVVIGDYGYHQEIRETVRDFMNSRQITTALRRSDRYAAAWRKSAPSR